MNRKNLKNALLFTGLFAVYVITGRLGLSLAFLNASATPVWAPTGIALAAFLLFGTRVWPAIFAGAFFLNLLTAGDFFTSLGIACGNTLEGIAGAYLVDRFANGRRVFEQPKTITQFFFLAGMLSTMISAIFGVGSLVLGGYLGREGLLTVWFTWWLGDMIGALMVTPFILLWVEKTHWEWSLKRSLEAFVLLVSLAAVSLMMFNGSMDSYSFSYFFVPFLLWAAFRFSQREAISAVFLVFGFAVMGTLQGHGPFVRVSANEALLALQMFAGVTTLIALTIASAVTQQKKAEEASMYLASIVENSEAAIISKSPEGMITSWNTGAQRLYGYTPKEVVGKSTLMLVLPHHVENEKEVLRRLAEGERILSHETQRLCKDGRMLDVSLTMAPLYDSGGRLVGNASIEQDITSRKEMEKQRQKQAKELAESLLELARRERIMRSLLEDIQTSKVSLEEQKKTLQEANKHLEMLSVLKDEFVATVSHELRTPLTAIKEGLSLLIDRLLGPLNEEQTDFLSTIDQNVDRLTELIHNMLDLSKIEAGRLRMIRRSVDPCELVRETVQNYKAMSGKRTLRTQLTPVPPVYADVSRIIQVIGNLFSNAVKFTTAEGTIRLRVSREEEGFITIQVEDDGLGMDQEDLPKLFKKFSQVGNRSSQGTGLGLALSKELVELHGGTIQVVSEPGKGSCFSFTLPAYTPKLAMEESFKEQLLLAEHDKQVDIGLIVLDAEPLFMIKNLARHSNIRVVPEEDAEVFVRKHLHESSAVCWPEPHRMAILMAADAPSLEKTVSRLVSAVSERLADLKETKQSALLLAGTSVYPADGADIHELYGAAVFRMSPHELTTESPHKR